MAQQRKTTQAAESAAPAEAQPNGVLVTKVVNDDGGVATQIQLIGDCQVTEIQTILELGLKAFRADVGLDQAR